MKLKNFLVVIAMLISVNAFSQFSLSGALGYGIRINNTLEYDLFQSSVSVEPQYDFGKFKLSAVALSINDSIAEFYTGIKPSYQVYESGNHIFDISVSALQGLEGKQLLGGGITYGYLNMFVSADGYNEFQSKQFIGNMSVGYYFLR